MCQPINRSWTAEDLFLSAEIQLECRNLTEALLLFNEAETLGFNADRCSGARWMCHMLLAQFDAAWDESDAIDSRAEIDHNRFWDGQPFGGKKVMVRCLHGLGDTLLYLRYLPLLRQLAETVTLQAQPPLKQLLQTAHVADHVITWGDPEPPWNQQVEIIEFPRIFRTNLATIPRAPYLDIPAGNKVRTNSLRVGLVWASGAFDTSRSLPFLLLAPLLTIPGVEFFSFQGEPERQQLLQASKSVVHDCFHRSGSVLVAAERLQSMHLLITVDTMLAHLGGAIGLPVWTLLPFQADWRWMVDRSDSPWYPTMRLFRQRIQGDWEPVVREVQSALMILAKQWALDREE